jgi:predicted hexulose-6-phosphate isomerase
MRSYLLGLYEKSMPNSLSLEEKMAAAVSAGYDYLELSIDESDEKLSRLQWGEQEILSLLKVEEKLKLPIKSICLSGHRKFPLGHPDSAIRARSLEIMEDAIILAARLGVRIIQIAGYDIYYQESTQESRALFGENLKKSVEIAAREGVTLAFETMETEFINTVKKARSWVDLLSSPYLQIYPDLGNITNAAKLYKSDVLDDLKSGTGHISAMHLKETVPGVYREVPYGTGHVNFNKAIPLAMKMGVRMYVGEFWYVQNADWREVLVQNNQFLRSFLDAEIIEE